MTSQTTGRTGDRIAGTLILVFAIWYGIKAGEFTVPFGDPAGPGFLPRAISIPMGLFAIWMIVRPDPDQVWFRWPHVMGQIATVAILLAYPFVIEPLGFPISTSICAALLSRVLGGTWLQSVISGLIIGFGLFLIFDLVFQLPLPLGPIFG